jgi:hypothetical protein
MIIINQDLEILLRRFNSSELFSFCVQFKIVAS